jgi:glutamate dehydrogenase (NAD(P)+)
MLHKQNADRLRARMVVEGANSPTTPAADEILRDNDILVVPDVMANAGGVVVSYFEWVQNLQHLRWEEREVNERLRRTMRKAFREVSERADTDQVSCARRPTSWVSNAFWRPPARAATSTDPAGA